MCQPSSEEPPYRLRVSPRARRMHLVVNATEGLTVVVPRRYDHSRIAPLLASRRDWIERAEQRFAAERRLLAASRAEGLPRALCLDGLGEEWEIRYRRTASAGVRASEPAPAVLVLSGAVLDEELAAGALRRFVGRRALEVLGEDLRRLAAERSLSIGTISVRGQRTRWASCSAQGSISLNRNLAFLPPRLVRLVLLHELCHRYEMSHSPRFWRLLDAEEPARRRLDAELRGAWRHVPYWARSRGGADHEPLAHTVPVLGSDPLVKKLST